MNAAGTSGGIPGGVEQKVVLGETGGAEMKLEAKENENAGEAGGAKTKPAVARTNSRLMRSAALVAQKRINATAGGTIAPAEVEAFRCEPVTFVRFAIRSVFWGSVPFGCLDKASRVFPIEILVNRPNKHSNCLLLRLETQKDARGKIWKAVDPI